MANPADSLESVVIGDGVVVKGAAAAASRVISQRARTRQRNTSLPPPAISNVTIWHCSSQNLTRSSICCPRACSYRCYRLPLKMNRIETAFLFGFAGAGAGERTEVADLG